MEEEEEESFAQDRWGMKYKKVKGRGDLIWFPRCRCARRLWSPRHHGSRQPCAPPRPQGRPYRRTPARDPEATPRWLRPAFCYSVAASASASSSSSWRSPCSGAWCEVGSLSGSGSEVTERRGPRGAAHCERGGHGGVEEGPVARIPRGERAGGRGE
jgi:hypothetical protein